MSILGPMGSQPVQPEPALHLKNPPIVEAAIGINIRRLSDAFLDHLRKIDVEGTSGRYEGPYRVMFNRVEMKIAEGQTSAVTKDEQIGWKWDSNDKLHAVHFKLDGFAFSRLGRYETWERFTDEAFRLWQVYSKAIGPFTLVSFGIRYVNKVFIPTGEEIGKYLQVYPKTPEVPEWSLNESVMRLGTTLSSPLAGRFVHQHILVPSDRPSFAAVVLDNDFQYPSESLSEKDLWDNIHAVRSVKDSFFRQLITPEFLETFNV